jgi:hypothetical protein
MLWRLVPLAAITMSACFTPVCEEPAPIHLTGLPVADGVDAELLLDDDPLSFRCVPESAGGGIADLEPADADVECAETQIIIRGSGAERIEGTVSTALDTTELDEEIEYVPLSASFGEQPGDECPAGIVDLE